MFMVKILYEAKDRVLHVCEFHATGPNCLDMIDNVIVAFMVSNRGFATITFLPKDGGIIEHTMHFNGW